jgi:hypothetical protein
MVSHLYPHPIRSLVITRKLLWNDQPIACDDSGSGVLLLTPGSLWVGNE